MEQFDDGNHVEKNSNKELHDITGESPVENAKSEDVVGGVEGSTEGPDHVETLTPPVPSQDAMEKNPNDVQSSTANETEPVKPGTSGTVAASSSILEDARLEVNQMIDRNELDSNSISAMQTLFRDYESMKEKVTKLKTLLGRSAKAQRDIKVDMENLQKKYDIIQKENVAYQQKIQKLQAAQKQQRQLHQAQQQRPTHMDVLADFEMNFDRALLAMSGKQQQQSGGQDTSGGSNNNPLLLSVDINTPVVLTDKTIGMTHPSVTTGNGVDQLLMQELAESKTRIDKLEQMNATFIQRCAQYEHQSTNYKHTIQDIQNKCSHYELEKKMLSLQNDSLTKQLQSQQSLIDEMQLEIELVTKQQQIHQYQQQQASAVVVSSANGGGHSDHLTTIKNLQEQNKAYEEWALASNHAKTLAQNRVRLLEQQLLSSSLGNDNSLRLAKADTAHTSGTPSDTSNSKADESALIPPTMGPVSTTFDSTNYLSDERILDSRIESIVIGAGDIGVCLFELSTDTLKTVNTFTHRIVLRYTFDILPKGSSNTDIVFSIYKGSCLNTSDRRTAPAFIKDRVVHGGAGGEIDQNDIFSLSRTSVTIVWSNQHSWIRPRTIKYSIEAVVLPD